MAGISALALTGFQPVGAVDSDTSKLQQDQPPEAKHAWKVTQAASSSEVPANIMPRIDSYRRIEAEDYVYAKGAVIAKQAGERCVALAGGDAFAAYPNVNLVMGRTKVKVRYAADRTTEMRVRLDEPGGREIAAISLPATGGKWCEAVADVADAIECHDLYLSADGPLKIDWFSFVPNKGDYKAAVDYAIGHNNEGKNSRGPGGDRGLAIYPELYAITKDPKYLKNAVKIARRMIEDYKKLGGEEPVVPGGKSICDRGFIGRRPLLLLGELALTKGDLTPEEKEILRKILESLVRNGTYDAGNVVNRSMGYYLGIPPTLRLFPDISIHKELVEYRDKLVREFIQLKQPLENSAGYETIDYFYLPKIIEDFNLSYLYQDPGMQRVFMNFKTSIYPSGQRPFFGDYGGKFAAGPQYISALETIASVYKDGRAKTLAHRMAASSVLNRPQVKPWDDGMSMDALCHAYQIADDSIPEAELEGGVFLIKRLTGHLDKVFFMSNGTRNSFNATFDLINGGEHSDNDALTLCNVAKGGRAHLYDVAGRDESNHSRPIIRDTMAEIPRPAANKQGWQFVCIDLQRHWTWDNIPAFKGGFTRFHGGGYNKVPILSEAYVYNPEKEFAFALTGSGKLKQPARFFIAEITLTKGNGEKRVIEDFASPTGWMGQNFKVVADSETGRKCGQFDVGPEVPAPYFGRVFEMPLDINNRDYDRLTFWFKAEGANDDFVLNDLCFTIGEKQMYPRNYLMHHNPMYKVATDYVADGERAGFGSFTLDERDYRGDALTRQRQCLFVKNEMMWVRDVFDLKENPKRTAAVMWRFDKVQEHGNWFLTSDEGDSVLYLVPRSQSEIAHKTDLTNNVAFKKTPEVNKEVVYQASDKGGKYFDALLIPLDPGQNAEAIAGNIRVEYDKDGVTLIAVGEDLMMMNPTGKAVSAGRITTDCAQLYIKYVDGKLNVVCGAQGSMIKIGAETIVSSPTKSEVLQKAFAPVPPAQVQIAEADTMTWGAVKYVPLRLAADRLGFDFHWDAGSQNATITRNSIALNFKGGCKSALVNGREWKMPAAAELAGDELMLPESDWKALRAEDYYHE